MLFQINIFLPGILLYQGGRLGGVRGTYSILSSRIGPWYKQQENHEESIPKCSSERISRGQTVFRVYMKLKKVDVWDQHWALAIIINDGKAILPEANLCRHLGFDSGTHYSKQPGSVARLSQGYIDFGKITIPFKTPRNIYQKLCLMRMTI